MYVIMYVTYKGFTEAKHVRYASTANIQAIHIRGTVEPTMPLDAPAESVGRRFCITGLLLSGCS
jgi:hypothetical protein